MTEGVPAAETIPVPDYPSNKSNSHLECTRAVDGPTTPRGGVTALGKDAHLAHGPSFTSLVTFVPQVPAGPGNRLG